MNSHEFTKIHKESFFKILIFTSFFQCFNLYEIINKKLKLKR